MSRILILYVLLGVWGSVGSLDEDPLVKCEWELLMVQEKVTELELTNAGLLESNMVLKGDVVASEARIKYLETVIDELKEAAESGAFVKMHTILGFVTSSILVLFFLWWLLPLVWKHAKSTGSAVLFGIRRVILLPTRLWASAESRADEYLEMDNLSYGTFTPEAMLANSAIKPMEPGNYHASVFRVFQIDADLINQIRFVGHGFWSGAGDCATVKTGVFVTALHNVPAKGSVLLQNANDHTRKVTVPAHKFVILDGHDMVYFVPDQPTTTTLGVKKAKVPDRRLQDAVSVTVYGRSERSLGMLSPVEDSVVLTYKGSSRGGFSGSPYVAGNVAYGLHVGSTQELGMGIDMGFVHMKLKYLNLKNKPVPVTSTSVLGMKMESSEDWLHDEIAKATSKGKRIQYREYGLDDVVVSVRGREHFMDRGDFNDLLQGNYSSLKKVKNFVDDDIYEREAFQDTEMAPKNCQIPVLNVPGTGANLVKSVQIPENPKLSKVLTSLGTTESNTTGQELTPVQSNEVSPTMFQSLSKQLKELSAQMKRLESRCDKMSSRLPAKRGPSHAETRV